MRFLIKFLLVIWWVHGLVVAKGFWWTLASFFIPVVSWYFSMQWLIDAPAA